MAPFYEELARVLSLGRIGAAKHAELDWLESGAHVLYAGVGSGEDAVAAVDAGYEVSALDLSPRMLDRLCARLGPRSDEVTLHCEDFFDHSGTRYDAVAMNFFLNVFSADELGPVLDHAISLLGAQGGRVVIADFARPRPGWQRLVFELHYRPLLWAAFALGLAALHPIHDYRREMEARGARLVGARRFGLYESLVFEIAGTH